MSEKSQLKTEGYLLAKQLKAIESNANSSAAKKENYINVAGVGQLFSTAYEQLRNAAEYAQERLLMQKAIRRFYVRNLSFQNKTAINDNLAEELIIELTQSGYIKNGTQPVSLIAVINKIIQKHYKNYWRLRESGQKSQLSMVWTLDLLSAESEKTIIDDSKQSIYLQFAYNHYLSILPRKSIELNDKNDNFEVSLYVAIHRALLKSDLASVRYDMQRLYNISDRVIAKYRNFHESIDAAFSNDLTDKLTRYINKYGAPLRILKSMIQDNDNVGELLNNKQKFDEAYQDQIEKEYKLASRKLNRGLIKSIAFLTITKSIIGIAVEVPYDLLALGGIAYAPLIINLLTPIVYMAILRLGIMSPSQANARATTMYADSMLYKDEEESQANIYPTIKEKRYPMSYKIAYGFMCLIVFVLVIKILSILHFNIVQGLIFFVFMSTASFLGYRLSRIIRDLEILTVRPNIIMTFRDFLFLPFAQVGKWLSEKYQKVNIVSLILDTIVELPLKTALRLIRQWISFMDVKKDEF